MMLVNGQISDVIEVLDRGLQYGDGLFETIAVKNSQLLMWDLHWNRLEKGCECLGIRVPDRNKLEDEAGRLISGIEKGILKIVVTRGVGSRGYRADANEPSRIVFTSAWPKQLPSDQIEGIALRECQLRLSHQPRLAGIKHLNRLENVLARLEWSDERFAEGLLLDIDENVVEATAANIFAVIDGNLVTPLLDRCGVAGTMRAKVIETATQHRINVVETRLSRKQLFDAQSIFITNCVAGIRPVRQIDQRFFDVDKSSITREIQQWVQTFVVT